MNVLGFIDALYEVQIESLLGYMNPFGYITKEVTLNLHGPSIYILVGEQ